MSKTKTGRLALRVEGDIWVAYYALPDTMKDAVFMASIKMGCVINPHRKQAFMDLMRDIISDFLKEETGQQPTWDKPELAPEHEKSGTA